MSFILPSPQSCCAPCPSPLVENIPGPQGPAGANGTNGTNGVDAYTLTTAPFVMPSELGLVVVNVANTAWMAVGQKVFVGKFGSAASGTFEVSQVASSTVVVLINSADATNDAYQGNSAPGTAFPSASTVSPSGLQGGRGTPGGSGAPTDATYVTQTPGAGLSVAYPLNALVTGLLHVTNGTGADGTVATDTSAGGQAPNDGALTAGQIVQATASGIKTDTAANTRTVLGLGTMATQNANAVNITGGTITGVTLPAPTGLPAYWTTFANQQAASTNGGNAPATGWINVPINTLLDNYGGNGTYVASNIMRMQAGTYRVQWACPMYLVDTFKTRLWNNTGGTVAGYGSNSKSGSTDATVATSTGALRITVAATTYFILQAQVQTANAGGTGFGVALGDGSVETYQQVVWVKES